MEEEVDPLDAFMAGNSVQLVKDDEQLKQDLMDDDPDPLDAFMSGHVLPLVTGPLSRGGGTESAVALDGRPLAPQRSVTPSLAKSTKVGSAAGRSQLVRRRQNSSDESSSEDDEEASSEEDDAVGQYTCHGSWLLHSLSHYHIALSSCA